MPKASIEDVPGDPCAYKVRWRVPKPDGGYRAFGPIIRGATPTKARNAAEDLQAAVRAGTVLAWPPPSDEPEPEPEPAPHVVTVAEWLWQRLDAKRDLVAYPSMRSRYRTDIENDPIGALPLDVVERVHVIEWLGRLRRRGLSENVIADRLTNLRAAFELAGAKRMPEGNPAKITGPKRVQPAIVVPTVDQVELLAAAMPPEMYAAVLVQAGLGLRAGELCGLITANVGYLARSDDERFVHVDLQFTATGEWRQPKYRKIRDTPLQPWVLDVLAEHSERWPPRRVRIATREGRTADVDVIFYHPRATGKSAGQPYRHLYREAVPRVAERLALAADRGDGPPFPHGATSHCLRHHYVTEMLHGGASTHDIAEWIGDTPEMIDKVYGHSAGYKAHTRGRSIMQAAYAHRATGKDGRGVLRTISG